MLLEIVSIVALAVSPAIEAEARAELDAPAHILTVFQKASPLGFDGGAAFLPLERAVSNWRFEAAQSLDLPAGPLARLIAIAPPGTPRCVKLNNYWCVKRAGWAGEIAADAEGHVAFASAMEGAVVAAMLLRRYYLVYNRRSAQAILSRWAPAQCGGVSPARGGSARLLGFLAPHGIANTLRARWLASHRPASGGGKATSDAAGTAAPRRSIIAARPIRLMPAPEIVVGMGEGQPASVEVVSLEIPNLAPLLAVPPCGGETARIHQYALRAIEGIVASPDGDLRLFTADGAPGANLALLMQNMAKVEIGPFAARSDLIAAAIDVAARRDRESRSAAGSPPDPAR
jgi:hypothetical protein